MPISLAPFRYRNIVGSGPLSRLESGPSSLWDGSACFDAVAELKAVHRDIRLPKTTLYSQAEGGGTHRSEVIARHIAISEALERWAFYTCSAAPTRRQGRFDIDESTTGMAAFPGITNSPARVQAMREAVERWAILEWWRGTLPALPFRPKDPRISGLEIATPFRAWHVTILWTNGDCQSPGRAFGFAAAKDQISASDKALIELTRNSRALTALGEVAARAGGPTLNLQHPYERRLAFFSSKAGISAFQERVAASSGSKPPLRSTPDCVVDEEIRGPWSEFATVWRVLFEHDLGPDRDYDRPDVFYF